MYEPKIGERVKIVNDSCGHSIPRGTIIKILSKHAEHKTWWVKGRSVFVAAEDIARLDPGMRKMLKNLDKSVVRAIEEIIQTRPELKAAVRAAVIDIANEVSR